MHARTVTRSSSGHHLQSCLRLSSNALGWESGRCPFRFAEQSGAVGVLARARLEKRDHCEQRIEEREQTGRADARRERHALCGSRIDALARLHGPPSVVGHVPVVHQGEDDYVSQPAGNSGDQIACGVIQRIGK
jgi:hypothetical protein